MYPGIIYELGWSDTFPDESVELDGVNQRHANQIVASMPTSGMRLLGRWLLRAARSRCQTVEGTWKQHE